MSKVQEFDLDIKPTKMVHDQGLCKLISENKEEEAYPNYLLVGLKDEWYSNIAYFLTYGECPNHVKGKDRRSLQLKATKFLIIDDILYKRGLDGMILRYVNSNQ